jgi:hypothetical protein
MSQQYYNKTRGVSTRIATKCDTGKAMAFFFAPLKGKETKKVDREEQLDKKRKAENQKGVRGGDWVKIQGRKRHKYGTRAGGTRGLLPKTKAQIADGPISSPPHPHPNLSSASHSRRLPWRRRWPPGWRSTPTTSPSASHLPSPRAAAPPSGSSPSRPPHPPSRPSKLL